MSHTRTRTRTHVEAMAEFGNHLIESGDVDPVYPVLRHIYRNRGWDLRGEEAFWQTALYLAFYKLPSGLTVYRNRPWGDDPEAFLKKYPTATERRGLRAPGHRWKHIKSLFDTVNQHGGSLSLWITDGWGQNGVYNYNVFYERCQTIWGNGRWAAFKWAELLKKVHGMPLAAPDMGLEHATGPRDGLLMVLGLPDETPTGILNIRAVELWRQLDDLGCYIEDIEQLETVLCNYHSYALGKYNVGHDIDEMLKDIVNAPTLHPADHIALLEARASCFDKRYLRERRGD